MISMTLPKYYECMRIGYILIYSQLQQTANEIIPKLIPTYYQIITNYQKLELPKKDKHYKPITFFCK